MRRDRPMRYCCDECGRENIDPELLTPQTGELIEPGWTQITTRDQWVLDLCPICFNMKFGHLRERLKEIKRAR